MPVKRTITCDVCGDVLGKDETDEYLTVMVDAQLQHGDWLPSNAKSHRFWFCKKGSCLEAGSVKMVALVGEFWGQIQEEEKEAKRDTAGETDQ